MQERLVQGQAYQRLMNMLHHDLCWGDDLQKFISMHDFYKRIGRARKKGTCCMHYQELAKLALF
ncbi:Uncharacterized protein TCM_008086 [Theobroma cacao]|uniref:Uncharacterized protein n=1 Tax=Theobroma cacao TaxID=3641 RepID=A0A061EAU0_THECC|nr:Uncharacterized protein TCM_008086 [Theobroma cacao]